MSSQSELMPVMAVGTAGGSTFLINPDTMTVYAKLRYDCLVLVQVVVLFDQGDVAVLINPGMPGCPPADPALPLCSCSGAHSKGVTALLPLASEAPGGPDRLLSAGADGTLALWDPSLTVARGADRDMSAKHSFKAHDSGIAVSGSGARRWQLR